MKLYRSGDQRLQAADILMMVHPIKQDDGKELGNVGDH